MIEIFRVQNKWRVKIVNETFEFDSRTELMDCIDDLSQNKEEFEPHKDK